VRIAVIGAEGQLGSEIVAKAFALGHTVIPFSHTGASPHLDVEDMEWVTEVFNQHRPEVVINTAALHSIEACEVAPDLALRVNALGARNVALVCAEIGALCVYISTDYVFGGRPPADGKVFWSNETPAPVNIYGWSKALGEHFVLGTRTGAIVRTAYLFGKNGAKQKGGNFVDKTLARLGQGDIGSYYSDVMISPTYARDAAEMILRVLRPGIYHAVNWGTTSVHEYVAAIAKLTGYQVEFPSITRCERPDLLRPRFTPLMPTFIEARPWREALTAYLKETDRLA
jgi:dTDP-4-dehydrorhamnose reductase